MDKVINPYRPGAGTQPAFLAGRDEIISDAESLLKRVKLGNPQRSIMLYGLRGVGKTVLLNRIETIAEQEGYIVQFLEISETDDFKKAFLTYTRKALLKINRLENAKVKLKKAFGILKAFSISLPDGPEFKIDVDAITGEGDSGDFESDMTDIVISLGEAAQEEGKYICFFIDETQYLDEISYAALIAASHRITQKSLPIVFVCAGLPQIAALSGDAKSYAERLYNYRKIDKLTSPESNNALENPAKDLNVDFTPKAISFILEKTEGYPYFIQEYGSHAWNGAEKSPITLQDVTNGEQEALKFLDESFFKVRLDRAKGRERKMMFCMAKLGKGPYLMNSVAKEMGIQTSSASPTRATLIRKGFVYTPRHGYIDFTVPLFDEFLNRTEDEFDHENAF
jgi:AAA+ ATPase superfamily predicted ATPase